ncbi:hypothetical protein HPB50_011441 [Hyalomma asiaticum]|uniref:Uncharacterized protein n=1 Tax=Hyalomma asiaticum TaxID=266040 RepID=A0ACB7STA1_HYAAI|nr:hypothetical protein HPB50_011441 [Hyalomma asiaticum]
MAPALLVVPDSSPLTRRRWSSGGVISPRSPVTPREFRGGGGLSPDLLSADRPETPEGERLDLRAIGAAVSALLAPNRSIASMSGCSVGPAESKIADSYGPMACVATW